MQSKDAISMRLEEASSLRIERFLREHLKDESLHLPPIKIYCGWFASLLTKIFKIGAITIGRRIFIAPGLLQRDENRGLSVPGWLIAHEAVHVIQFERAGLLRFAVDYIGGYLRALRAANRWDRAARMAAYLSIDEECEARTAEEAYSVWRSAA